MSAAAFQTQLESDQFTRLSTLNKNKKYPLGGCGGLCEKWTPKCAKQKKNRIVFIARSSSDKIWYRSLNPHFTSFSFAFIMSLV